jgi:hypothetical protein
VCAVGEHLAHARRTADAVVGGVESRVDVAVANDDDGHRARDGADDTLARLEHDAWLAVLAHLPNVASGE